MAFNLTGGQMAIHLKIRPAVVSLLAATAGVSLSTALGGSAAIYFGSIAVAGAFGFLHLKSARMILATPMLIVAGLSAWLFLALVVRDVFGLQRLSIAPSEDPLKIIAIIVILLVVACIASLPEPSFRRAFSAVAAVHIAILLYGLLTVDLSVRAFSADGDISRFDGAGFKAAAWAEVSLGTIMAAVLSGRKLIFLSAFPIGIYAILAADMRTTLIGAAVIIVVLLIGWGVSLKSLRLRIFLWIVGLYLIISIISFFYVGIASGISGLLLLDDPHRGISSGFSNRFENLEAGWEIFLEHLIFGAGFSNPVVNYTHNGYILTLAQMGMPAGAFLLILLIRSLIKSLQSKSFLLLAVIIGLCAFYLGQPRNINFQLCPLVGIIAVGRALMLRPMAGQQSTYGRGR